jgi:hypothetical protein
MMIHDRSFQVFVIWRRLDWFGRPDIKAPAPRRRGYYTRLLEVTLRYRDFERPVIEEFSLS